ncbi:hypothetical protein PoB_004109500 [Plakobranchus ocellatus]|uniref:Uncharacterized protein n=1 Tax=Plakobranchus ocellatus TaxID=259542 RepID=A0AAV4B1X1_9GAST|nr:hypothetical protein PoB_004109500 [Plakobranchus ocellatus]
MQTVKAKVSEECCCHEGCKLTTIVRSKFITDAVCHKDSTGQQRVQHPQVLSLDSQPVAVPVYCYQVVVPFVVEVISDDALEGVYWICGCTGLGGCHMVA